MRKHIAKYQIEDTFKITGRGIVLAGVILEGTISIGNSIEFDFKGKKLERKITGVEGIKAVSEKVNIGVLIVCINEKEIIDLKNWEPKSVIGTIYT